MSRHENDYRLNRYRAGLVKVVRATLRHPLLSQPPPPPPSAGTLAGTLKSHLRTNQEYARNAILGRASRNKFALWEDIPKVRSPLTSRRYRPEEFLTLSSLRATARARARGNL